jgi:hypothetical protein
VFLAFAAVRPETPAVLVAVQLASAAWAWLGRASSNEARGRFLRSVALLGTAAVCVGLLASVRKLVFGITVPNPATMKTGGFDAARGFDYLERGLSQTNPAMVPLLLVSLGLVGWSLWKRRSSTATILTAAFALASTGFIVLSGGDWMPCARFVAPVMPAFIVLVLVALDSTTSTQKGAGILLCIALLWVNVQACRSVGRMRESGSHSLGDSIAFMREVGDDPGFARFSFVELVNKSHRRDAQLLVPLLDAVERIGPTNEQPVVILSGQAGMVPYWAVKSHFGAVRFLDWYSLTSKELLACVPARYQQRGIHGIRIDTEYVLAHADELEERCGIPRPTVIFDAALPPGYLGRYGFRKIYEHRADPPAYAAVHESYAAKLGLQP